MELAFLPMFSGCKKRDMFHLHLLNIITGLIYRMYKYLTDWDAVSWIFKNRSIDAHAWLSMKQYIIEPAVYCTRRIISMNMINFGKTYVFGPPFQTIISASPHNHKGNVEVYLSIP